jgi:hypothetical protein
MSTLIDNGYNIFTGADGKPLEEGYIFIGEAGLNPISNPQTVYWDAALTIPATNIRTTGGYPMYNGSPARLYSADNYSILVQDKTMQTVYVQLNAEGYVDTPSASVGFDNTYVEVKSSSTITVKEGSTADVNGLSIEVLSDVDLQVTDADTDYYIQLLDTGTVSLTTNSGTFDVDQNARYSLSGRILNWIIRRDDTNTYLSRIFDPYNLKSTEQSVRRNEDLEIASLTATIVNTGQGDNKLYAMDQDVQTTDGPTFEGVKTDNVVLKQKVVEIGGWDMITDSYVLVPHGLSDHTKVRGIQIIILSDSGDYVTINTDHIQTGNVTETAIRVLTGLPYETSSFDDDTVNRGYLLITYEA